MASSSHHNRLPRFYGLDLPEFPYEDIATSQKNFVAQLSERKRTGSTTIVRRARLLKHPSTEGMDLKSLLLGAERQFELIADACDATVVNHTFGLMRRGRKERIRNLIPRPGQIFPFSNMLDCVPDGYQLVAEVDICDGTTVTPYSSQAAKIKSAIHNKQCAEAGNKPEIVWADASTEQFLEIPRLYLHDIEPIVIRQSPGSIPYRCGACANYGFFL